MTARTVRDDDVPALHALLVAEVPPATAWTADELRRNLFDAARAHGGHTAVVEDGGVAVAVAGWVEAPPWVFGAPVLARDEAAGAQVIARVVERAAAIGAERVRISAHPGQAAKRAALAGHGFAPVFDFLWVARPVTAADAARDAPRGLARVGWAALDADLYADVHNDTFDGVPNAAPLSTDAVREVLAKDELDRDATAAWTDAGGGYAAFVEVERGGDPAAPHVVIAAIGVRAPHRRRGLAGAIVDDVLARAAATGARQARALIASTNAASLGCFASRGFRELERFTVYERVVTPA